MGTKMAAQMLPTEPSFLTRRVRDLLRRCDTACEYRSSGVSSRRRRTRLCHASVATAVIIRTITSETPTTPRAALISKDYAGGPAEYVWVYVTAWTLADLRRWADALSEIEQCHRDL